MPDGDELHEIRARLDAIERHLGITRAGGEQAASPVSPPPPVVAAAPPAPAPQPPPAAPPRPSATPKPAMETRIGAHWLNRIGIAAVLIGVAFFLKFAFDNNWIGPGARVLTGAVIGAGLLAWAERFRKHGHELFAHTLDVLGTGVLYLSIWAAS